MTEQSPDLLGRLHPFVDLPEAHEGVGDVRADGDVEVVDPVARQSGYVRIGRDRDAGHQRTIG